jgi:formylglycine-generating enzyme required for sulfatase activity
LSCNANESPGTVASVSAFRLDRYEVTVGRFRKWVDVGSPEPAKGAGLHTHLGGGQLAGETGWDTAWPIPTDWDTAL